MSDLITSVPHLSDRFVDPFSVSDKWRRHRDTRRAVRDVADISDIRAQAHNAANLFRDLHVSPAQNDRKHELRRELQDTKDILGRWALMAAHEAFRTVDLARVKNRGKWDATIGAEQDMAALAWQLGQDEQLNDIIPRDSVEAKRRIMVDPTIIAGNGLVLVRRKRLMLATKPEEHTFTDMRPRNGYGSNHPASLRAMSAQQHLEVDKVSEFVLDLRSLRRVDAQAADEIASVVESGSPQEVTRPEVDLRAPYVVEAAIDERHEMLTPVTTTYYADRKYRNIRAINDSEPAAA